MIRPQQDRLMIIEVVARWLGRGTSLVSIGLLSLFAFDDPAGLLRLTPFEATLFCCFPLSVVSGLILSWSREGIGSALVGVGLGLFYLVHRFGTGEWPGGPYFLIFASPAWFFITAFGLRCWAQRRLRTQPRIGEV